MHETPPPRAFLRSRFRLLSLELRPGRDPTNCLGHQAQRSYGLSASGEMPSHAVALGGDVVHKTVEDEFSQAVAGPRREVVRGGAERRNRVVGSLRRHRTEDATLHRTSQSTSAHDPTPGPRTKKPRPVWTRDGAVITVLEKSCRLAKAPSGAQGGSRRGRDFYRPCRRAGPGS
jgi:hypothetical protein